MGPALRRGLKPNGGLTGEGGEVGLSPQSSWLWLKSCQHVGLLRGHQQRVGGEKRVGPTRGTASEGRTRRTGYFRRLLRRDSRGTGMSSGFYSPGKAHFWSSNSENAPLDDNKLILIKQVGVSRLSKRGALESMTEERVGGRGQALSQYYVCNTQPTGRVHRKGVVKMQIFFPIREARAQDLGDWHGD